MHYLATLCVFIFSAPAGTVLSNTKVHSSLNNHNSAILSTTNQNGTDTFFAVQETDDHYELIPIQREDLPQELRTDSGGLGMSAFANDITTIVNSYVIEIDLFSLWLSKWCIQVNSSDGVMQ